MKLKEVKLENFRGYKDETVVDVDDLTVFVGKNDVGKSTILEAIDVFFNKPTPDLEDACVSGDKANVRVTCVFSNLPKTVIVDATNPTSLSDEYLLNASGRLEICKKFDCSGAKAKLDEVFIVAKHPSDPELNDLLSLTIAKLRALAVKRGIDLNTIDQTKSAELRKAIWASGSALSFSNMELPVTKGEGKGIWDQLQKMLPVYALFKSDRPSTDQDAEAQDPMNIAIRQAIDEQKTQLEAVTKEIEAKVQEVANRTVAKIRDLSPELAKQLKPRVTTKKWDSLFKVDLSDEGDVPINKRGSGVRRLVLLSFFRAQAEQMSDGRRPIIYAIEEPETSQHPNNQKMLAGAFGDIIEMQACQVLLTTHTPVLARCFDHKYIRFVTNEPKPAILPPTTDNLKIITDTLGILPDHSVKAFLGVEGRHDISCLRALSSRLHLEDSEIPDLALHEDQGSLVFVPMGGSSLGLWVNRVNGFHRPQFYLMDRDAEPSEPAKYQTYYERFVDDGHTAWITSRRELENYIHVDLIKAEIPNYEGTGSGSEDVPHMFAKAVHENSESTKNWEDVVQDSDKLKMKEGKAKRRLNDEFASKMTLAMLAVADSDGGLVAFLKNVGKALAVEVRVSEEKTGA